MLGTVLRLAGAVALAAAVAGSLTVSRYLALLEAGIEQDVRTARRIVAVQEAVMEQNEVLGEMVAVTGAIGSGLDGVIAVSEAIHGNVVAVAEANRSTLATNRGIAADNGAAVGEMAQVAAALAEMNAAAAQIEEHLIALRATVAADADWLDAVRFNTAAMNARTPGW